MSSCVKIFVKRNSSRNPFVLLLSWASLAYCCASSSSTIIMLSVLTSRTCPSDDISAIKNLASYICSGDNICSSQNSLNTRLSLFSKKALFSRGFSCGVLCGGEPPFSAIISRTLSAFDTSSLYVSKLLDITIIPSSSKSEIVDRRMNFILSFFIIPNKPLDFCYSNSKE